MVLLLCSSKTRHESTMDDGGNEEEGEESEEDEMYLLHRLENFHDDKSVSSPFSRHVCISISISTYNAVNTT